MKKTFLLLIAFVIAHFCTAQDIKGYWNGELNLGVQQLGLEFNFANEQDQGWKITMNVPVQGAFDIPCEMSKINADSIYINANAIGASYAGKITQYAIDGVFSQHGMNFPLVLKHGRIELTRSQTPKSPLSYETRDFKFQNKIHEASLSGTLSLPIGYKEGDKPKVVLMVTGSGMQDRDESVFGHRPFFVIADYLARNGIASLRYDDRGTAMSTGDVKNNTTTINAEDAAYGLDALRKTKMFSSIGVLGHSEGGTIAFMLKPDFIISLAGMAVRGDSALIKQNNDLLTQVLGKKTADDYCTVMRDVLAYKEQHGVMKNAMLMIVSFAMSHGITLQQDLITNLVAVAEDDNSWQNALYQLDPTNDLKHVSCPVMAINGSKDMQVNANQNLGTIRKNVSQKYLSLVKEYPELNHLLQHCQTGMPQEYGIISETISEDVLKDIVSWILKL